MGKLLKFPVKIKPPDPITHCPNGEWHHWENKGDYTIKCVNCSQTESILE